MKTIERGYFKLDTPEGVKYAHFSRTFLKTFKDYSGKDIFEWGGSVTESDDVWDQFDAMTDILIAGMMAYDLEEDLECKYNVHKVGNWLWDAMQEDTDVGTTLMTAFNNGFPKSKEVKGNQKS